MAEYQKNSKKEKHKLEFNTLGALSIILDEKKLKTVEFIKQHMIQDLIILLILHRKDGLPKKVIFNLFWTNYSERSKRSNLNTLIYRLNKSFGINKDFLKIDRNYIYLNMDSVEIDVDNFLDGVETVKYLENDNNIDEAISIAFRTLKLYRGDFFENISTDLPLDEERLKLKHIYQTLLFSILRLTVYKGLYRESLEFGRKLISSDPYCEPAYRLIMTALGFLGNRSELIRLYVDFEKKLRGKYRIDPDEKTLLLKNSLLLGINPEQEKILEEVSIFF
ncbi:MAG: BTAD domain-containing putative transcriptional regulator [Spirochaetia bacterium]|jgi:two-component SAPR family response regulator|nr:BTAD domain-containing putative transcriptional regulator [Spirochaetia bacterium]